MSLDLHLIGCCSSSGSTLLAHVLDGLHDLRVGPEYGAFHHRALYAAPEFGRELYRVLSGQAWGVDVTVEALRYSMVPPVFLMERDWYGVEGLDAEYELLRDCPDLPSLFGELKARMARTQGIEGHFGWVDQTPKNCVAALEFLRAFPEGRFVHLVRDGRDVMASLLRRYREEYPGHPDGTYLTIALVHWTWDQVQALRAEQEPGYLRIAYEAFVTEPLTTVNQVLRHLGRPEIDQARLDARSSPTERAIGARMKGGAKGSWTQQPTQPITAAAVGRWRKELEREVLRQAEGFRWVPPGESDEIAFAELQARFGYA